jgi:hypothetical protein
MGGGAAGETSNNGGLGGSSSAGVSNGGSSGSSAAGTTNGGSSGTANGGSSGAANGGSSGNSAGGTSNAGSSGAANAGSSGTSMGGAANGGSSGSSAGGASDGGTGGSSAAGASNGGAGGDAGAGGAEAGSAGMGGFGPDLTTGLLAHYTFEEAPSLIVKDVSGSNNHATIGTNGLIPGHASHGLNLDGRAAFVTLPAGITAGVTDFSISIWVKPRPVWDDSNRLADWSRIFDFGSGQSDYVMLAAASPTNDAKPYFELNNGNNKQAVMADTALKIGVWQHLAVVQAANTLTIYLDGVVVGKDTNVTNRLTNIATTKNWFGRSQYPDALYNGGLDEFAYYSRALSVGEIKTLAGVPGGDPVQTSNLLIAYNFEDETGVTVTDQSGNAQHATILDYGFSWVDGAIGKAFQSDGDLGYLKFPDGILNGLTAFTWSAWVKRTGPHVDDDWQQTFDFGNDNRSYFALIATPGDTRQENETVRRVRLALKDNNVEEPLAASTGIVKEEWVHIAATRADTTFVIYVNGENVGQATTTKQLPAHTFNNWFGRSQWPDTLFNAAYDEIRIYDRSLSGAAVKALATK